MKLIEPPSNSSETRINSGGSERLEDKRAVLKLVFAHKLAYHRIQGYRTARMTLPFKALEDFSDSEKSMVPGGGFEPPTRGFSIRILHYFLICSKYLYTYFSTPYL